MTVKRDKYGKFIRGETSAFAGREHSIETKIKIGQTQKGKKINKNQKRGLEMGRKSRKGCKASEETIEKLKESHLGIKQSDKTKRKRSLTMKKMWTNNKNYRIKVLKKRKMSGLENKINNTIKKYNLPYKFVGNGKFFIEHINPDFINTNGEKVAVEAYWKRHKEYFRNKTLNEWINERSEIAEKYGWKMIFLEGTRLTELKILKYLRGGEYY